MLHIHQNRPVFGLLPVQCMLRGWRACIFISILSLKVYINIVVHSLFPTALRQKIWKCCSTGIRSAPLRHPPPTSPERPTGVRCVCPAWPTRSPVCPLSLPAGICWMMMVDGVLWSWFPAPRGEKGIRYRKKCILMMICKRDCLHCTSALRLAKKVFHVSRAFVGVGNSA